MSSSLPCVYAGRHRAICVSFSGRSNLHLTKGRIGLGLFSSLQPCHHIINLNCLQTLLSSANHILIRTPPFPSPPAPTKSLPSPCACRHPVQPEHHPSFEALFATTWASDQRESLKTHLSGLCNAVGGSLPKLFDMYEAHQTMTGTKQRLQLFRIAGGRQRAWQRCWMSTFRDGR